MTTTLRRAHLLIALQRRMLSAVLESSQEFVSPVPSEMAVDYAVFGTKKQRIQDNQPVESSQDAHEEHVSSTASLSGDHVSKLTEASLNNDISDDRINGSSKSAEPDPNCARGCCIPQTSCELM